MIMRFVWHLLTLALGLYLVTLIRPLGITFDKPEDLFWAALVLILVNAIIKPILIIISLPLVLLTLGLFLFIISFQKPNGTGAAKKRCLICPAMAIT